MKTSKYVFALIIFILPILGTIMWFYSGLPKTSNSPLPDFPAIDFPQPPLSTSVALPNPPDKISTDVLIDMKHGNMFALSEIDPLLRNIESLGGAIEIYKDDSDLASKLKTVTSFLVPVPMSSYSTEEMQTISSFVERGGRLVVITDPTRNTIFTESGSAGMSGVDAANLLLEPFDLSFRDDYLYNMVKNEGNFRNIIVTDISGDPLMKDIRQLVIYGGHSLNTNGTSLVTVDEGTSSSTNEHSGDLSPIKISSFQKGQVLAIGDISLMTVQYIQSADNQIFVRNLARFLTESIREKTLAEFPFLFKGDVVIQPAGEIVVDGELLSAISNLKKAINSPATFTISQDAAKNVDRILLTTFESNTETKDLLKSLEIDLSPKLPSLEETVKPEVVTPQPKATVTPTVLPKSLETEVPLFDNVIPADTPEKILVPGMGIVKTSGLGVIGLVRENERFTLIIMANSQLKIQELINQLSTQNMKNCLIHNNLAACRISGNTVEPIG